MIRQFFAVLDLYSLFFRGKKLFGWILLGNWTISIGKKTKLFLIARLHMVVYGHVSIEIQSRAFSHQSMLPFWDNWSEGESFTFYCVFSSAYFLWIVLKSDSSRTWNCPSKNLLHKHFWWNFISNAELCIGNLQGFSIKHEALFH